MASYKVISDNFAAAKKGATVSESELDGLNLQALLDAGHIAPAAGKTAKTATEVEGEE